MSKATVEDWDFSAEQLLTPAEVGAAFKVGPNTVTRWAKSGRLAFVWTPGGHRRYSLQQVTAILHGGTGQAATARTPAKRSKRRAS